jgi:hypothetical protein
MNEEDQEATNELWVMIKTDEFFRSKVHNQIEDELITLIEHQELGAFDGHSSGSYQFDLNFYDVTDFEKAKAVITAFLKKKYPELQFVISHDYEATFDQL